MLGLMHQSYALPERQALQLLLVNIVLATNLAKLPR